MPLVVYVLCLGFYTGETKSDWLLADESAEYDLQIEYHNERLTLEAKEVPLDYVLRAMGEAAGFDTYFSGALDTQIGTWSLVDMPLVKAIRKIAGHNSTVIVHRRSIEGNETSAIAQLRVYEAKESLTPAVPKVISPQTRDGDQHKNAPQAETEDDSESQALGKIEQLEKKLIEEKDRELRLGIIAQLEDIGGEQAVDVLESGLEDKDPARRMDVVSSLGRIDSPDSITLLGQVLFSDPDPEVRKMAREALSELDSKEAQELVREAAEEEDGIVHQFVTEAPSE